MQARDYTNGVWAYPWSLAERGFDEALGELDRLGIDRINVAALSHSVRTLDPRDGIRLQHYPGGCFFDPGQRSADGSSIDPPTNEVPGMADPLAETIDAAAAYDIGVNAWTVCLHNSRVAAEHPSNRPVDAFGNDLHHGLCPSNDAVRRYLVDVVERLAEYDVERIDLESIGYPTALHGHGDRYGHLKNFAVTSDAAVALLSQCFCEACRESAAAFGVDLQPAAELIRDRRDRIASAAADGSTLPSVEDLFERPELDEIRRFRQHTISGLVESLAAVSGDVPLHYYVADGLGRGPRDGRVAGIDLEAVGSHLDSVTALYYAADRTEHEGKHEAIRSATGVPTEVGVTVDPAEFESAEAWYDVVDAARAADPAGLSVYNYSLLTEEHVGWLEEALRRA